MAGDMTDAWEWREYVVAERSRKATNHLIENCENDICAGKKTTSADGREVVCECGLGCRNNSELPAL